MKTFAALCLACCLGLFAIAGCSGRATVDELAPDDDATETTEGMDYMGGEGQPPGEGGTP